MRAFAWRNPERTLYGIRIERLDRERHSSERRKSILIYLDELHEFPLEPAFWGYRPVITGEPFAAFFEDRIDLDWGRHPPVFDLAEMMVPIGERRRWRLLG